MRWLLVSALAGVAACASAKVTSDDAAVAIDGAVDAIPDATPDAAPDATIATRSLALDTAAEFDADTGALLDATIEPRGAIAPIAYYTGGLLQHGSDTGVIVDPATTTWATIQGFTPTSRAAIQWSTVASWGSDTPPSVGLTDGDSWTMWYEGEIFLEAGTWSFALLVDDDGFVELATPGSTTYARVVNATWPTEATGTFTAAAAGWYPIRYAISDKTVNAQVQLRFSGPGVGLQPIPRERLRVRVDGVAGLLEAGFDDARGVGDVDTTIDLVGSGSTNWNTGNPGDLGMTASDTFSVRWAGQVRVDVGGTYTFRYVTDDGQRLWIDGVKLLDSWDDVTHDATTAPVALAPGWHDVVIDHSENVGGALALLSVATGPALVGEALPPQGLRPVEGRAERIAPGVNHADVAIPDSSSVQQTIGLTAPVGAVVTSVDVSYELTHAAWGDLVITLKAPNGSTYVTRNRAGGTSSSDLVERFTLTNLNGGPVAGVWTLIVQDAAAGNTGTLLDVAITPHYAGGIAPIPTSASFESIVHDLGDVVGLDAITWTERSATGAAIAVRVRTCATQDACAATAWSAPVTISGGVPAVTPARFVQYRVDLTTDGDHAPAVESLKLDYRVAL